MKIVIFAGGYGKRLWPLSRKENPKQFQKLFGEETTLENSYNTIKQKFAPSDIFISTNEQYVKHVFEVIPGIPKENLIIEPEPRDTGAAVAFAMLKIAEKFPDEPVVIRWQNSLIKDPKSFLGALNEADSVFKNKEAEFVYLCVPAKFPNTGVGYIHMGEEVRSLKRARSLRNYVGFTEKPDLETAKKYETDGNYGWNPGCYITTPRFVLSNLEKKVPEFYEHMKNIQNSLGTKNEDKVIRQEFAQFEKLSIDYLLWEKLDVDGIKVVLADYDWHYVSSWDNLKEALDSSINNVASGQVVSLDTQDSLIYNYDQKNIVTTLDVQGLIIVNTPDALLITSKKGAGKVKDLLNKLEKEGLDKYL